MPKWISVTDHLPEQRERQVLVHRDNGSFQWHQETAVCTNEAQWYARSGRLDDVTHWQPLPGSPDDPEPACQHPEDQLEAVECLDDVLVCAICGAVLLFEGGEQPFRQLSAAELEARIYKAFQEAHEALEAISGELYSVGKTLRRFDAINRDNPILRAEREARHARIEEALKKKLAPMQNQPKGGNHHECD